MKLRYAIGEDRYAEYSTFEYNNQENTFVIRGIGEDILEYHPVLKLDAEYCPSNFQIFFFNNHETTENSIFEIITKNHKERSRIGWMFPIQALLSKEHSQANNPYFLKYAYIASYLLLDNINTIIEGGEPDELTIDDIYDIEKNLLIIDKENCSRIDKFDYGNYIVGLFQYGYTKYGNIQGLVQLPTSYDNAPGKICIKRVSEHVSMIHFINVIFEEHLSKEESQVMKFYFCYQIVEMLIQDIFENEFRLLIAEISSDTERLFDLRDKMSEMTGEKRRIKHLFINYTNNIDESKREELNESCKRLLTYLSRDTGDDVASNLYAVRCLLVHKLYTLSTDNVDKKTKINAFLKEINTALIDVLINMLFTFHCV